MRVITEENYQDLVQKALFMNDHGELQQRIAMGITLALSKMEKPDCNCDWHDDDEDAETLPPNYSKN